MVNQTEDGIMEIDDVGLYASVAILATQAVIPNMLVHFLSIMVKMVVLRTILLSHV